MIMIASDGLTNNISNWRSDLVSKIIEQLGLERIMFEASDPKVSEWLIEKYGSKVRCSLITFVNECL